VHFIPRDIGTARLGGNDLTQAFNSGSAFGSLREHGRKSNFGLPGALLDALDHGDTELREPKSFVLLANMVLELGEVAVEGDHRRIILLLDQRIIPFTKNGVVLAVSRLPLVALFVGVD